MTLMFNYNHVLLKFLLFFCIIFFTFTKSTYSNEIKSLKEILNNQNSKTNSLITMQRCAAIYGALYYINPTDVNSDEYENRFKIFLQSAVIEDIKINNENEDESYKNQIEEFKSSIKFFLQIYLQNYKKNNSYLKNHWIEDDFFICEKF